MQQIQEFVDAAAATEVRIEGYECLAQREGRSEVDERPLTGTTRASPTLTGSPSSRAERRMRVAEEALRPPVLCRNSGSRGTPSTGKPCSIAAERWETTASGVVRISAWRASRCRSKGFAFCHVSRSTGVPC